VRSDLLQGTETLPPDHAASAQPAMMSAADVARELSVSVKTVRRLDLAGKLPRAWRIGRAVRWRRAELLAWIMAGCPPRDKWTWGTARK